MRNNRGKKEKRYYALQLGDHLYYAPFSPLNLARTRALVNTAHDALAPYHAFLSEAIKAENKRANHSVEWQEIKPSGIKVRLQPTKFKIRVAQVKPVLLIDVSNIEIKDDKNRLIYNDSDKMITFQKKDVELSHDLINLSPEFMPETGEKIELNGQYVDYDIDQILLNKKSLLKDENDNILDLLALESIEQGWDVWIKGHQKPKKLFLAKRTLNFTAYPPITFEKLFDDKNQKITFSDKHGLEIQLEKEPESKDIYSEHDDPFHWIKLKNISQQDVSIQLIDDDSVDTIKATSDYFFDDGVREIYQGKDRRRSLSILRKKSEEKILVLKRDYRGAIKLNPKEPIKIVVNTAVLKRQRDAIQFLNHCPVESQKKLIQLFERKTERLWETPEEEYVDHWFVLNDESYDGVLAQRNFVKKALATPDFAILEGPPGSGKTTVIIELILQILKQGKKILLAASTHVAIDNVLERIQEHDNDHVVEALRIGDSNRIDESVQKYQIDTKIETYQKRGFSEDLANKMVLDGANLVCGTTMGIQQHPYIKERNDKLPIFPQYDYMIIDESSKTTFQEFLVPALHAKKWVLVGDIKQLSPFVEQSHIVHNFNALVPQDEQQALQLAFEALENNKNPYVIEVKRSVIDKMDQYLSAWQHEKDNPYNNKVVSCYRNDDFDYDIIKKLSLEYLLGSDLILLESGLWEKIKSCIPKTHIVILEQERDDDAFFFQQLYQHKHKRVPRYQSIDRNLSRSGNPLEMKEYFKNMLQEQSWAEAIAWRMIRVYERRMLKKPDSYYEKTFKLLKPTAKDNAVDRIYNMTLPSILESLQQGNGEHHRNRTTITEGFEPQDLNYRHTMLDYQHRMHPEISKFSRDEFYTHGKSIALRDGTRTERAWSYHRYSCRSVWLNVAKKNVGKDRTHKAEVDKVIDELKAFVYFAQRNKKEDGSAWSVAVLTFYRPQETLLRKALQHYCSQPNKMSRFEKSDVKILCYTVDRFQGMEADLVFLSMVRGKSIGFLDNINRLNVALTRARFQRVIVGDLEFFKQQGGSEELKRLASQSEMI